MAALALELTVAEPFTRLARAVAAAVAEVFAASE